MTDGTSYRREFLLGASGASNELSGGIVADLPRGVSESYLRETAVDDLSRAIVNIAPQFAAIIRDEYAKFHRLPPVGPGRSTSELSAALLALRAKFEVIRDAAESVLQYPLITPNVVRILLGYCERTGLTEAASTESASVMTEISLTIRMDVGPAIGGDCG